MHLEVEAVEDRAINSGDVEVKDGEVEVFECSNGLEELTGPPGREDLEVGMSLDQRDLNVSNGRLVLCRELVAPAIGIAVHEVLVAVALRGVRRILR